MENLELTSVLEKGRNIDLIIHLMRHGKKWPDGNLSEIGLYEAQKYGSEMGNMKNVKVYTSFVSRVIETALSIKKGADIDKNFKQRNKEQLSVSILKAPGKEKPSYFFKEVVLKRLAEAYAAPENIREQKIKEVEYKNMQEWLSYDDTMVDETTNSPKNVARAVAYVLVNQINMTDRLEKGSNLNLLDVTHEFMLAAIIRYTVEKQDKNGVIFSGKDIMREKGSIDYLESLDIKVHINNHREKEISLTIKGEPYTLKIDTLYALANEYKEKSI